MEEHAQNDVKSELAVEYSKLHIMSVSNTIGILFISWKMIISLISLCLTQYLYPAMVVKNVFPIHATRVTDIVDWLYCMKISEKTLVLCHLNWLTLAELFGLADSVWQQNQMITYVILFQGPRKVM